MGDGQLILMNRKKEKQTSSRDIVKITVCFQKLNLDKKLSNNLIHVSHLLQLQVSHKKECTFQEDKNYRDDYR